ncbi:MAG: hypothetical protein ACYDH6_16030 [Acidimicrobiales bacterium]
MSVITLERLTINLGDHHPQTRYSASCSNCDTDFGYARGGSGLGGTPSGGTDDGELRRILIVVQHHHCPLLSEPVIVVINDTHLPGQTPLGQSATLNLADRTIRACVANIQPTLSQGPNPAAA